MMQRQKTISNQRTKHQLNNSGEHKAPFPDKLEKFCMTKHEANTNHRQGSRSIACKLSGVRDEARELEAGQEQNHASNHGDNIWVRNNAEEKFCRNFALE